MLTLKENNVQSLTQRGAADCPGGESADVKQEHTQKNLGPLGRDRREKIDICWVPPSSGHLPRRWFTQSSKHREHRAVGVDMMPAALLSAPSVPCPDPGRHGRCTPSFCVSVCLTMMGHHFRSSLWTPWEGRDWTSHSQGSPVGC